MPAIEIFWAIVWAVVLFGGLALVWNWLTRGTESVEEQADRIWRQAEENLRLAKELDRYYGGNEHVEDLTNPDSRKMSF